jgi:hypothetical protein
MRGGYLSGFVVAAVVCEVLFSIVVGFVDDNRA